MDRELRPSRSESVRRPGARDLVTEEGNRGRRRRRQHDRLDGVPDATVLRESPTLPARGVPRSSVAGHRVPDPEYESELVRGNAAEDAGATGGRYRKLGKRSRCREKISGRFSEDRFDGILTGRWLGAGRRQSRDAARVRAATRLHVPP